MAFRRLLLSSRHLHRPFNQSPPSIFPPSIPIVRFLSTEIVHSISDTLTKLSSSPNLSLHDHFSLHFADVTFTTPLLSRILDSSPAAGRAALDLFDYLTVHRGFAPNDHSLSLLIHYFGRRRDFKAAALLLSRHPPGPLSLSALIHRLARAGRPSQAVAFFETVETNFQINKSLPLLKTLVAALTENRFPSYAERIVKASADDIFPDEEICNLLIKGWCNDLKLDEARRLEGEILRGGFELGTSAYNAMLDCICRLCRKKDPVRMKVEMERFLKEMDEKGVGRDVETFRVVVCNLCKVRKTEDALRVFRGMGEWNCSPDGETYLALVRSLYQAARVSEGDEMIGWMRAAGFGGELGRKEYYGFVKILCGIERVEHAMKVFRMMKGYGHVPGVKTYDLLIGKLVEHGQKDRANVLFKEAVARGVGVVRKEWEVNPRFVKKKVKKEKKRETLPEKMKKKRLREKRWRLSFVKKPRPRRRLK